MISSDTFLSSCSLKYFYKMLQSTTLVIRCLCQLYNSSNIRYVLCHKPFVTFLEHQISKDKPTPLLAVKNVLFG